jgi:hypothetical protein
MFRHALCMAIRFAYNIYEQRVDTVCWPTYLVQSDRVFPKFHTLGSIVVIVVIVIIVHKARRLVGTDSTERSAATCEGERCGLYGGAKHTCGLGCTERGELGDHLP